jgi:hypothetical protein
LFEQRGRTSDVQGEREREPLSAEPGVALEASSHIFAFVVRSREKSIRSRSGQRHSGAPPPPRRRPPPRSPPRSSA